MHLDDLRRELRAIAADAPPRPHDASTVIRPATRRLWLRRATAAVAAVAAVAVVSTGAVVVARTRHDRRHLTISGPGTSASTTSLPAGTIAHGRWTSIASSPLESRSHESVIWTGSKMIVWGGDNGQLVFGDGAAYDPTTNTWRALPPAPIAARTFAAAVWSGREMIVWGGDRQYVGDYANDGAAFDPVTWTWRRIASGPLTARYSAAIVWTGARAVVFGGLQSNNGDVPTALDAAEYEPATDTWRRIAPLPGVAGATIWDVSPVWTGTQALVWEGWVRTAGNLTTRGFQLVEYDPTAGNWRRGPAPDDPHRNVFAPIWTGHEVIAAAEPPLCDLPDGAQNCGPPPTNLRAGAFDPTTGTWRSLPHGPADDGQVATVWTGDNLVVVSGGVVDRVSGAQVVPAGTAAAWDPDSNRWTPLPAAPSVSAIETPFWTGREILLWGADRGLRFG